MRIELRNVHYAAFASDETACFQAAVYLDGEKAGEASNEGRGGCNRYWPRELEDRLAAHAATLPEMESGAVEDDGSDIMIQPDADTLIGAALDDWLARRDLTRLLKSKVVFAKDGKILATPKLTTPTLALLLRDVERLRAKYQADAILNVLPFDEAVALYRKVA